MGVVFLGVIVISFRVNMFGSECRTTVERHLTT